MSSSGMSIILSGLIHVFRPLLSSLSGALDCKGLGPWYFLLGLRIVAIFFSNGPWDSMKEDVVCSFVAPIEDRSRSFCTALCHNQHFPESVSGTWGLVFIALLLLVGLMRLTSPEKKKKNGGEAERRNRDKGLAIVENVPHRGGSDVSTVYWVGRRGLPRRYGNTSYQPRYAPYDGWHGTPVANIPGGYGDETGAVPCDVGGYGMPVHAEHMGQTNMGTRPTDCKPGKISSHCTGADQYGMCTHQGHMRRTHILPQSGEKGQYNAPTKCVSVPFSTSPCKSKMPPHYQPNEEYSETIEYGAGKSSDYAYTIGAPASYPGQGKMVPRYCEDGQCTPDTEGSMEQIAVHLQVGDNANVAIKRRPVQRNEMQNIHHRDFNAGDKNGMGFGSDTCTQPWMPDDSTCRPIGGMGPNMATMCYHGDTACTCADPHCMAPPYEPPCEPCYNVPCSHDRHRYRETHPGPQERAKMSISKICGIPLFDIWVALLLAMEICFFCYVIIFQLPTLFGRTWICSPGAMSCPSAVECTVKARAEKRVALWGLAFTAILFIIACTGYFNLRFCWNKSCRRMCGEEEGEAGEEDNAEDTEGRDAEAGGEGEKNGRD